MNKPPTIAEMQVALIKRFNDPSAPILIDQLGQLLNKCGPMFTKLSTKEDVEVMRKRIWKDFTDDELNMIGYTPEFIIPIMSGLMTSLIGFVMEIANNEQRTT